MSSISAGIVGLPNIGKSTLFNALLKKQQALAANYPFATVEPNIGIVPVPDTRLITLAEITKNEENMSSHPPIKPAIVEFVDIAGLVKGASEGQGLGNKFLSHIREVSVIAHVVRAFDDPDVIREGSVSPIDDYKTIQLELILADLQTLQKTLENRKLEPDKKAASITLLKELNKGKSAREVVLSDMARESIKDLFLLSIKPEIIVINVSETDYGEKNIQNITQKMADLLQVDANKCVVISAKVEAELSELSDDEQIQYLKELGMEKTGLERLIQKAYEELGLISFLTAGEKEVRAWTIKKGTDAQHAAGVIHTDFIKKFIKAEVISFTDFVNCQGWKKAKETGRALFMGRDYIVADGDVIEFKIGS